MSENTCEIEVRVRYAETDRMGYLHHSRYAVYLEMGRTELLRLWGVSYRTLEDAGVFFVVAKMALRFRAPACYDDVLTVETRLERMTAARIDHVYRIFNKGSGRLLCEAETTLACVDADGRVTPIPEIVATGASGE